MTCKHENTMEYPHQNVACDDFKCDVTECEDCGYFTTSRCDMTNANIEEMMDKAISELS